jgi:hypothetical protein
MTPNPNEASKLARKLRKLAAHDDMLNNAEWLEQSAALLDRRAPDERWRQIDTAPKDGTWFLAVQKNMGGHWMVPDAVHWTYHGYWTHQNSDNPDRMYHQPTHWMPLPSPPSNEPRSAAPTVSDASSATSEAVAWVAEWEIEWLKKRTSERLSVLHIEPTDGCIPLYTHPAQQQRQPQGEWVVDDAMIDRFDAAYRRGYDKAAEIPNARLSDMKIAGFTAGRDAIGKGANIEQG